MKTMRNTAVLILIALTGGVFAQLVYCAGGSAGPGGDYQRDRTDEVKYSLPEIYMYPTPAKAAETEAVLFEEEIGLELWMTVPFELNPLEKELVVEAWMTEPFDICLEEPEPELEAWMTEPFNLPEEYKLTNWLIAAWW